MCVQRARPDVSVLLQHTLRHLSRLSNAMLSEDACASVASGQQPKAESGDAQQLGEERSPEEAALSVAEQDGEIAARLPRLKLKSGLRMAAGPVATAGDCKLSIVLCIDNLP